MSRIKVTSRPERFRRAGFEFTREGTEIDTATISEEQFEAIKGERALHVVVIAESDDPAKGGEKAAKADGKPPKAK